MTQQVDVPQEPEFWPRSAPSVRLLLLDENPEVARALQQALGNCAVSLSIAEDHPQAEQLMQEEIFDALVVRLDNEARTERLQVRRTSDIVDLLLRSPDASNEAESSSKSEEPTIRSMQSRPVDINEPSPSALPSSEEQSVPLLSPLLQGLVGMGRPFSSLQDLERHVILCAFEEAEGNLSQAARTLGLPRSTLRDRLKRFGVRTSP